jgi:hypothetical protein
MSMALIQLLCQQKNYVFARFEIERTLLWNPLRPDLFELLQKIEALESNTPETEAKSSVLGGEIFG